MTDHEKPIAAKNVLEDRAVALLAHLDEEGWSVAEIDVIMFAASARALARPWSRRRPEKQPGGAS